MVSIREFTGNTTYKKNLSLTLDEIARELNSSIGGQFHVGDERWGSDGAKVYQGVYQKTEKNFLSLRTLYNNKRRVILVMQGLGGGSMVIPSASQTSVRAYFFNVNRQEETVIMPHLEKYAESVGADNLDITRHASNNPDFL